MDDHMSLMEDGSRRFKSRSHLMTAILINPMVHLSGAPLKDLRYVRDRIQDAIEEGHPCLPKTIQALARLNAEVAVRMLVVGRLDRLLAGLHTKV